MAIKVTLTNKSQQTKTTGTTGQDGNVRFNRLVYQRLRSLIQNKTILADYEAGNLPAELVELFDEFDKISFNKTTKDDPVDVSEKAAIIDEYLSSLGLDDDYFYSKDRLDILPWIDLETQAPYRNVITDIATVDYNIIVDIDGTDYNVIHDTTNV